jgi:hypothetical protein
VSTTSSTRSTVTASGSPTTRSALGPIIALVSVYLTLSLLTIAIAIVFRGDLALVNSAVWIRGSIVAVTAALMLRFAVGARSGNPRAYLRLRITSAVMVVAIAVILVAIPGDFPLWMRIEQATCGALLIVVVVLANRSGIRAVFAKRTGELSA